MKHLLLFLLVSFATIHTAQGQKRSQVEKDNEKILKYIADNGLDAMDIGSGVYYVNEETGEGDNPHPSSRVHVVYKGYYTNGRVFDESGQAGARFSLDEVILGWKIGIPFFKEGGRGKLLIPSGLGYGNRTRNGIPGNSVLIFDIHLIEVL